jgi:hypothetical protein
LRENDKKVILTTDQDLIENGVQAIDYEFLQWFVKNPSCESVEVESVEVEDYVGFAGHTSYPTFHSEYKIIIPKEELKQETLEEVSERILDRKEVVDEGIILKRLLITILLIQILLIFAGIWQLTKGKIGAGLFNIIINTLFGLFSFYQIKKIKNK